MDGSKLKNYILALLALVNIFLAGIVMVGRYESAVSKREAADSIRRIYDIRGIRLPKELALDRNAPARYTLMPNTGRELELIKKILGEDVSSLEYGTLTVYESPRGAAAFSIDGIYTVTMRGMPISEDPEADALTLLACLDIDAGPDGLTRESGIHPKFETNYCKWRGYPVWGLTSRVEYSFSTPSQISGKRLPDIALENQGAAALDIITILAKFLEYAEGIHWQTGGIINITQGYMPGQSSTAGCNLEPVWRFETDAGIFYLDGVTGDEITSALTGAERASGTTPQMQP